MKNNIISACAVVLAAVSCRISPEYGVSGTHITLQIEPENVFSSCLKVGISLDDDRNYYYVGAVPADEYDPTGDNTRFMQLCVDSLYVDYVEWRYDLLVENEEYIADFQSHYLHYGDALVSVLELKPDTRYAVYAFCVNPDSKEPVGDLYYEYVTTKSFQRTDQTFQIKFTDKKDGAYLTVIPSDDSRPYIYQLLIRESFDGYFGGSGKKVLQESIDLYTEYHFLQYLYTTGFSSTSLWYLTENEEYIVLVSGIDGGLTTDITGMIFTYPFDGFQEYYESTE